MGKQKTECRRAKTGRSGKPVCVFTVLTATRREESKRPMEMKEQMAEDSELIRSQQSGSRTEGRTEGKGREGKEG